MRRWQAQAVRKDKMASAGSEKQKVNVSSSSIGSSSNSSALLRSDVASTSVLDSPAVASQGGGEIKPLDLKMPAAAA